MTLLATLALAALQAPCPAIPELPPFDPTTPRPTREPAGDGLWMGGLGFGAADLASAVVVPGQYGDWAVLITLTQAGEAKFAQVQRCRIGKAFEISVDRQLVSVPTLVEYITGRQAQLTANADRGTAEALAARIRPAATSHR